MLSPSQILVPHLTAVPASAPIHASLPEPAQVVIGALFVLIAAAGRFNSPPTNRCSTTALRFHLAASCYLLFEMILYLGVVYAGIAQGSLVGEAGFFGLLLSGQSAAPLAALVLTVLLPKIPLLAEADGWVIKQLQRMGAIPFEARRLAAELRRSRFTVPAQLREKVAMRLVSLGFNPEDVMSDDSPALDHVWAKITALLIQIEEWEIDRRFVGFLSRFPVERQELKGEYDRLAPTIQLLCGMALEGRERSSDRLMLHVQNEVQERSADLLGAIYTFVSRGLLQCGATYGARVAELIRLGFDARGVALKPRVTMDQLIALFLAIEGTVLGSMVILGRIAGFGHQMVQMTMVSTMYTVAVVCAVFPKESWSFARRDRQARPVAFYVAAGLLATAASLVIRFTFQLMVHHRLVDAWKHFRLSYPYSFCAFIAAFMVAWMIDDRPTPRLSRDRLRWLEALIGGATLLFSSFTALRWIEDLARNQPDLQKILAGQRPMPVLAIGLPTVIGFGIAYLIPTWYREGGREHGLVVEPAAAEKPAVVAAA